MSDDNLWGEIPKIEQVETPLTILKKQAIHLGNMTNNLLESEVVIHNNSPNEVTADLLIVAPTLGGYKVGIIRISHKLEIYPVHVNDMRSGFSSSAYDEGDYIEKLKEIFQSDKIRDVIKSLLIQVDQSE